MTAVEMDVDMDMDRDRAGGDVATDAGWVAVCRLVDLVPERGAAALVDGEQVALFRLVDDTVLGVQQLDPYAGANVMSRGIVGSRGDRPTVASPLHKQVFDLLTGECLDPVGRDPLPLRTWRVRCEDGTVLVSPASEVGGTVLVPPASESGGTVLVPPGARAEEAVR